MTEEKDEFGRRILRCTKCGVEMLFTAIIWDYPSQKFWDHPFINKEHGPMWEDFSEAWANGATTPIVKQFDTHKEMLAASDAVVDRLKAAE